MPIAADFDSIHTEKFPITFTQCLPNQLLKYTELCNMLQLTAAAHAEKGGISFTDMQQDQQAWVMSKMRIEISEMPRWRDNITVKTWIVTLENSRSVRALEVYRNDKKVVGCETFWAVINTKIRRPEPLSIPHEHFEKFENHYATENRITKIIVPDQKTEVKTRAVLLSDLDIVNHVNNVKYLEWCLDCEDPNKVLTTPIKVLEMNFVRELVLGDNVKISNQSAPEESFYALEKQNKNCFLLKIEY